MQGQRGDQEGLRGVLAVDPDLMFGKRSFAGKRGRHPVPAFQAPRENPRAKIHGIFHRYQGAFVSLTQGLYELFSDYSQLVEIPLVGGYDLFEIPGIITEKNPKPKNREGGWPGGRTCLLPKALVAA